MSTQTSRRPFLRALRGASPALWPARMQLAALKASYKAGNFSGHPEETLDAIAHQESKIRRYKDGVRPVKPAAVQDLPVAAAEPSPVPAPATVERGRTAREQREYEELTARCHVKGGPFEPGLDAAERRLAYMQYLHRTGGYLGHPEDLHEDIDIEERRIARLKAEAAQSA